MLQQKIEPSEYLSLDQWFRSAAIYKT